MTKFEEEAIKEAEKCGYVMAKSKIVFYEDEKGITFVDFNGTHTNFNFPWLEFAKNWHSDEEFQELKEQHGNQAESILLMLEEIDSLKSQLQQQALPVVPECVAEWYEEHKDDLDYSIYSLCEEFDDTEPNREPTEFESWFDIVSNQPILTLVGMRNGYTVEKPQLFYLKNKLTTSYLALDTNTGYYEHWGEEIIPKLLNKQGYKISFTQSEIGSMETGSYELVPVEDGE